MVKAVVVREGAAASAPFRPTRAQREYLRAKLDDARGTLKEHAKTASVNPSTVYRWLQDPGFQAWVKGEEMRLVQGYVPTVLMRAKEIALSSVKPVVALKAIDVLLKHMPGRKDGETGEMTMRAILASLIRPAPTAVQVVVNSQGPPADTPARALEVAAMTTGVMSLTRNVGPVLPVPEPPGPKPAPPAVETPHVNAALRELEELKDAVVEEPLDPWAGLRRGRVDELDLSEHAS